MKNRLVELHARLLTGENLHGLDKSFFVLLKIVSVLFETLSQLRAYCYDRNVLSVYRSTLPVVSVGNLAVGGTGKTPVTDYLLKLVAHKGLKPAVVSRGYGGDYSGSYALVSDGKQVLLDAQQCGDEPLLLAKRNPGTVVVVARRRADGLRYLEENFVINLVILDDGFQHMQVARDLDIVLLDSAKPFGNGYVLPAGILRERRTELARADLVLLTRYAGISLPEDYFSAPVLRCRHRLGGQIKSLAGEVVSFDWLKEQRVVLFAGVADPLGFFQSVQKLGVEASACLTFSDHVEYGQTEIKRINEATEAGGVLLTTEKDAVKLKADNFSVTCYVSELEIDIEKPAILEGLLLELLERKGDTVTIQKELLEILACPKCKGEISLQETNEEQTIVCAACRLAYPVRDNIPVMLIDEAQPLEN